MTQRRVALIAVLIGAAGLFWLSATARNHDLVPSVRPTSPVETGFRTGESAPDFELRSLDGRRVRLSGLRGKPVLLNFWATWCAPCRLEMPWLVELDQQYRPYGVEVVGVSLDDASSEQDVAKFANDNGVKYKVLLGNSSIADSYGGVRFMPQSFFIDRDGRIKKTAIGLTDKKDLEDGVKALLTASDAASHVRE